MRYWSAFIGLVGLLSVASLYLLREREPVEDVPDHAERTDSVAAARGDIVLESDAVEDRSHAAREATAIDLRGASPTFRNSTLLFAIRRGGFACADVISAHESAEGVWVASCSDMLGYIVTLRGAEQFDVHPVAQYFDSLGPAPDDRDRSLQPRSLEPRSLEPQPLPR